MPAQTIELLVSSIGCDNRRRFDGNMAIHDSDWRHHVGRVQYRASNKRAIAAMSMQKKTPIQIANEWYTVDEVHRSLNSTPIATRLALRATVPRDVTSREFAEWLCDQYRMAMAKGIQLGRGEE